MTRHVHLNMKKREDIVPDVAERIVIVGGGFAGVTLAQRLERFLPAQTEIIVLSADNHLVFTPMLPEVVGRTISPLHVFKSVKDLQINGFLMDRRPLPAKLSVKRRVEPLFATTG